MDQERMQELEAIIGGLDPEQRMDARSAIDLADSLGGGYDQRKVLLLVHGTVECARDLGCTTLETHMALKSLYAASRAGMGGAEG